MNEIRRIASTAREAALASATKYYEMSGGRSVHEGALETFVSAHVAEAIYHGFKPINVELETTFRRVKETSFADMRGRPRTALPDTARFDVTCFRDLKPWGLIEVKKSIRPNRADTDVIRLSEAVRRYGSASGGSVQFGLLIALVRIIEGARDDSATKADKFMSGIPSELLAVMEHTEDQMAIPYNRKDGKSVTGLCAYSILFRDVSVTRK